MDHKENAWMYVRQRGSDKELERQIEWLQEQAAKQDYTVVGITATTEDQRRKALRQLRKAMREQKIDVVMVTRLTNLSHDNHILYRLLCEMQDRGIRLECSGQQMAYELHLRGLQERLRRRAHRKNGFVPW